MRWLYVAVFLTACTDDLEPRFPADYAATYTEVRDCRSSSDHDLHRIRVLADPAALGPYTTRTPFPVDSVVLKAEYDFGDTACTGSVVEWTVMQKLATPETLGWVWQRVAATRSVTTQNDSLCITCHTSCGVAPDGYDGTCTMP